MARTSIVCTVYSVNSTLTSCPDAKRPFIAAARTPKKMTRSEHKVYQKFVNNLQQKCTKSVLKKCTNCLQKVYIKFTNSTQQVYKSYFKIVKKVKKKI